MRKRRCASQQHLAERPAFAIPKHTYVPKNAHSSAKSAFEAVAASVACEGFARPSKPLVTKGCCVCVGGRPLQHPLHNTTPLATKGTRGRAGADAQAYMDGRSEFTGRETKEAKEDEDTKPLHS
eukprot:4920727-Pyramimonas_sp.AAC.1